MALHTHKSEKNTAGRPAAERAAKGESDVTQTKADHTEPKQVTPPAIKNHTGLPDQLKSGIENLSGLSMDDVKVHYNSSQPAQLQAHAYAQGTNIHVAPGQERHLPHEAWHVVQQKQGRVAATKQLKGHIPVNDDSGLEKEADTMGAKALQLKPASGMQLTQAPIRGNNRPMQFTLDTYKLAGTGAGLASNMFGTSTFTALSQKLTLYQDPTTNPQTKKKLLESMKELGEKWLAANSKKTDKNAEDKRNSIRELLSRINEVSATRLDNAMYFKAAKKFEHNLGLYLYNLPAAQAAATNALNKMAAVMGVTGAGGDRTKAADVFGGNDARYAGNVGKDVERVMGVINGGNMREKMTAFYNASLGSFKNMLDDHMKQKGTMAGQTWDNAKASLTGKGIGAGGLAEIEHRKAQIDDYPNKFGWGAAKAAGFGPQLQDVYVAAADFYTRDQSDALRQGQKGLFEKEGRQEAFNLGDASSEAFNFNFEKFDFKVADLKGVSSGLADNLFATSTYAKIKTELQLFETSTSTTAKLHSFRSLKDLNKKWINDNRGKTEPEAQTKMQEMESLRKALGKVYSGSTKTQDDLTNVHGFDAKLSDREKEFIMGEFTEYNQDESGMIGLFGNKADAFNNDAKLPWEEGGTRFNPDIRNNWVETAIKELKMPVVAGPSGTTDRMLKALKFLGAWGTDVNPGDFRLALLGWMLTSNDHSFHEIMSVSKSFGLPYEPGPYAYHDIAPLTVGAIRAHVCENSMFPDEIVYDSHRHDFALVKAEIESTKKPSLPAGKDPWAVHAGLAPHIKSELSPASAAAIRLYTGGSYLVQNPAEESDELVAKATIHAQVKNHHELTKLKPEYESGAVTLDSLHKEAKHHNAIFYNALKDLPPWAGTVYRGQGSFMGGSYKIGQTETFHKFTSSSKNAAKATTFMKDGLLTKRVLIKMAVNKGKDISSISRYTTEEEVMLPPGSTFLVTQVIPDVRDNTDNVPSHLWPYTRVVMTQQA